MNKVIGIIPARYGSTRFPGKPLAFILGKTLLQRTYENACLSRAFDKIYIATDHSDIYEHAKTFTPHVIMTSSHCQTGTDRIIECIQGKPEIGLHSIIVNIQGDEPCVEPEVFETLIKNLQQSPQCQVSTAVCCLQDPAEANRTDVVKCIFNQHYEAIYFSRTLIPFNKLGIFDPKHHYYKHIGIYAYRRDFLLQLAQLPSTPLQLCEDLEQLKVIEHGYKIKVAVVKSSSIGVDIPEDIKKIETILCR